MKSLIIKKLSLKLIFASISLLMFCLACSHEDQILENNKVEPYAVEFIEFKNSSINIYFNRIVDEKDVNLYLIPHYYSDTSYSKHETPCGLSLPLEKTSSNKLELQFPFTNSYLKKLKRFNSENEINDFIQQTKAYFEGNEKYASQTISFGPDLPNHIRVTLFQNGHRLFDTQDFIEFSTDNQHNKNRSISIENSKAAKLFNSDICRYFKGTRNSKRNKQGKWIWYYYNKNKMVEAEFENDKLIGDMTFYSFNGTIQNIVKAGKTHYSPVH